MACVGTLGVSWFQDPSQERNVSKRRAWRPGCLCGKHFPHGSASGDKMASSCYRLVSVSRRRPAGSLWPNCNCSQRVRDPLITRAKYADGMIPFGRKKVQHEKNQQHTRGFAGFFVPLVYRVLVVLCSQLSPEVALFQQDSGGRQFEEWRQRKRSS